MEISSDMCILRPCLLTIQGFEVVSYYLVQADFYSWAQVIISSAETIGSYTIPSHVLLLNMGNMARSQDKKPTPNLLLGLTTAISSTEKWKLERAGK